MLTKSFQILEGSSREREKYFNFASKGIIYQIAVIHSERKRKGFLVSGKQTFKKKKHVTFQTKCHRNYKHIHEFIRSYVTN